MTEEDDAICKVLWMLNVAHQDQCTGNECSCDTLARDIFEALGVLGWEAHT